MVPVYSSKLSWSRAAHGRTLCADPSSSAASRSGHGNAGRVGAVECRRRRPGVHVAVALEQHEATVVHPQDPFTVAHFSPVGRPPAAQVWLPKP